MSQRYRWFGVLIAALLVGMGGLMLGKFRERDYLGALYQRKDFTLLDDKGDFFSLHTLPERKLALLVFTPDGIPTAAVDPFYDFSKHLDELRSQGIEPYLVSRVNREIVRNFKHAARFSADLLLDSGGTVSRNAGVWDGTAPAVYWAYALVDREFNVLWRATESFPLPYSRLIADLQAAR